MNCLTEARFAQMRDDTPVWGEPVPENGALIFIGGEFDGMTTGIARGYDPYAKRKAWLNKVGIDSEYTDYMTRAKEGLTARPSSDDAPAPADYAKNFRDIWPEAHIGRIQDPTLAELAAHAMQPSWEAALEQERLAGASRNAILFGKGVLEVLDEQDAGMLIGPFLTRMEYARTQAWAGHLYEAAHFAGESAVRSASIR